MPDPSATGIAAVSWQPNRLDLFVRSVGGGVSHKAWDSGQWFPSQLGWEHLGGVIEGVPVVASWGPNRLDVFATAPDMKVFHKAWDGQWRDWEDLGGLIVPNSLSVVSWGPNRLDVVGTGTDLKLFHKAWAGTEWSDWRSLGGHLAGHPHVASLGPNRLDVVVLGGSATGHYPLLHKVWDGRVPQPSWSNWHDLGGWFRGQPAITSWGPNRLDVFGWGEDLSLYHNAWNGVEWLAWESLGGKGDARDVPAVSSWGSNRIDVFANNPNGGIMHKALDHVRWTDWEQLDGVALGSATAVSWEPGRLDVFVCGADGGIWHMAWNGERRFDWESLGGSLVEISPPVQIHERIVNITGRWRSNLGETYDLTQQNSSEFSWFISSSNSRGAGRIDGTTLRSEIHGFHGLDLTVGRITEFGADGFPSKIFWDNGVEFAK